MGVKLIGFEKLETKLTKSMDLSKVKATVKKNGAEMQKKAMKEAPVLTHHLQKVNYVGNYRWWHDCRG